jgi:hypothetical protein
MCNISAAPEPHQLQGGHSYSLSPLSRRLIHPVHDLQRLPLHLVSGVDSLVVGVAEKLGTKDAYASMQSLYENAIVINAMVEELSVLEHKASLNPGYYEEDLIKKSIALGEYRMIALDNVYRYQTATGANKNSYKKVINKERFIIQNSIDQLRMRQEMLDGK